MVRKENLGRRMFDYIILIFSIISFISGPIGLYVLVFYLKIVNIRPYLLLGIIFFLGIIGFKMWRKENVD